MIEFLQLLLVLGLLETLITALGFYILYRFNFFKRYGLSPDEN